MPTARHCIQDALEKIGVYAPGEDVSAADAMRSFHVANDMIDSWSNESLTCFAILEQSGALQPGINQYSIGPGGAFNITRPIRVITGPGAAYLLDSNENRYPVDVYPRDKWNLIWNLVSTTSNLPTVMFYDPQSPLAFINVWPMPNTAPITLFWDSYLQLTEFPDLDTDIGFPPGYEKSIKDNLAIELIPYFKPDNYQVPALLIDIANKSKGNVKRSNQRENQMLYDPEITGNRGRPYNIYDDGYR